MAIMVHGTPEEKSMLVFDVYDVERTGYVDKKVWSCFGLRGERGEGLEFWMEKENGDVA
jgi:hypothetical protein